VMVMTTKLWDAMSPAQQASFEAAAQGSIDAYTAKFVAQEKDVVDEFKKEGKKIYTPDLPAFRSFAQKKYVTKYGNEWPKGALERINAL
jgi:TRAP-type transport system periplasmic protein